MVIRHDEEKDGMMADIAFRLFEIAPHWNNKHDRMKDDKRFSIYPNSEGGDSMQAFVEDTAAPLLHTILRQRPRVYVRQADLDAPGDPAPGDPCFYIEDIRDVREDVLEFEIYRGEYGDLDYLVSGANGGLTNIHDDAATRRYLVRVAFPEGRNVCYVAAQMRYGSQAGSYLFDHLMFQLHKDQKEAENRNVKKNWYRFISIPRIDGERFNDAVGNADVEVLRLLRHNPNDPNGDSQKLVLELSDLDVNQVNGGLRFLRTLANHAGANAEYRPAIDELATLFPAGYMPENADWDDGQVVFTENGKRTTISASKIKKLFTYPLGEDASIEDMWSVADAKLQIIGEGDHVDVPHII